MISGSANSNKKFLVPKDNSKLTKDISPPKALSSSFVGTDAKTESGLFSAGTDNKFINRTDYHLCPVVGDGNCAISAINTSIEFITGKKNTITRDTLATVCDNLCKLTEQKDYNKNWENILKNCFKNFNSFWYVLTYEKNVDALSNIYSKNFNGWEDFFKYLQSSEKTSDIMRVVHSKVELVLSSSDENGLLQGERRQGWTRENYRANLNTDETWVDLKELVAIANYLGFVECSKYNHETGGIVVIWQNKEKQQIGVHLNCVKLKSGNIQFVGDGPDHFQAVNGSASALTTFPPHAASNILASSKASNSNIYFQMDVNFDDSSDEETVETSIESYNIIKSWKDYVKNAPENSNKIDSFLLHAVGVSILYSDQVNRIYYPLKAKYLSQETYPVVKQIIDKILLEVAAIIAKEIIDFKYVIDEYNKDFWSLEEYMKEIKILIRERPDIQQCIEEIIKVPHILRAKEQDDLSESAKEIISQYINFISTYIQKVVVDYELKEREPIPIEEFENLNISKMELNKMAISIAKTELRRFTIIPQTEKNFTTKKEDREKLFKKLNLSGYITRTMVREPNRQSFNKGEHAVFNSTTKKLYILQGGSVVEIIIDNEEITNELTLINDNVGLKKLLDSNIVYFTAKGLRLPTFYPELIKYTGSRASIVNKGASIERPFSGPFSDNVTFNIGKAYLTDLIKLNNNQPLKPGTKAWEASTKIKGIEQFFPFSGEIMEYIINQKFHEKFFKKLLKKILPIERKTFNLTHTFPSDGGLEFLANLRLSNREQTRKIKNLAHVPILKAKNLGISGIKKHIQHRTWSFLSQNERLDAIERQQITLSTKGQGRQDWVDNGGSYQELYSEIANIKTYFKKLNFEIVDRDIAIWVRQIINSQPLDKIDIINFKGTSILISDKKHLKNCLVGIAYLILGNEAARNPASLPINQMMLDLILAEIMTWKDALTNNNEGDGEKMPMSPDGAISVARNLHGEFNSNMPFPYEYKGSTSMVAGYSANDMSKKESSLFKLWIEHVAPECAGDLPVKFDFIRKYSEKHWFWSKAGEIFI